MLALNLEPLGINRNQACGRLSVSLSRGNLADILMHICPSQIQIGVCRIEPYGLAKII